MRYPKNGEVWSYNDGYEYLFTNQREVIGRLIYTLTYAKNPGRPDRVGQVCDTDYIFPHIKTAWKYLRTKHTKCNKPVWF